ALTCLMLVTGVLVYDYVRSLSAIRIRDAHARFFQSYGHHRHLHSFPTRRSSDLRVSARRSAAASRPPAGRRPPRGRPSARRWSRSEEHTSELQSRGHLVCRVLLEKKK